MRITATFGDKVPVTAGDWESLEVEWRKQQWGSLTPPEFRREVARRLTEWGATTGDVEAARLGSAETLFGVLQDIGILKNLEVQNA